MAAPTVPAAIQRATNDYEKFLPSASVKIDVGLRGRITASAARTSTRAPGCKALRGTPGGAR